MAFLSPALLRDEPAPAPAPEAHRQPDATFSPTEWRVIELAGRDDVATLGRAGLLRRIARRLFGSDVGRPLADARLESLRRAAVRHWRGGAAIEQEQVEALIVAGFTLPQVALLSRYVSGRRKRG